MGNTRVTARRRLSRSEGHRANCVALIRFSVVGFHEGATPTRLRHRRADEPCPIKRRLRFANTVYGGFGSDSAGGSSIGSGSGSSDGVGGAGGVFGIPGRCPPGSGGVGGASGTFVSASGHPRCDVATLRFLSIRSFRSTSSKREATGLPIVPPRTRAEPGAFHVASDVAARQGASDS